MTQGKEKATSIHKSFDQTGERIKFFKAKCSNFTKEAVAEIESAMKLLQAEIDRMTERCVGLFFQIFLRK